MENTCSRCGSSRELEFASDGMRYCSSCIFYGSNDQCYRCRMYIPKTELQDYRGQLYCPYCIQDQRDEQRSHDKRPSESLHERVIVKIEKCERCGTELKEVFIWNGKRLCKRCYNDGKALWDTIGGPPDKGGATVPYQAIEQKKKESLVQSIISRISGDKKAESKRKQPEIVALSGDGAIVAKSPQKPEKTFESDKKETLIKDIAQDKAFGPKIEGLMHDPKKPKFSRKLVS